MNMGGIKTNSHHDDTMQQSRSRFKFQGILSMMLLGIVISCLSEASAAEPTLQEHRDGSSNKERFSQSIHMPQPKMNGRPVIHGDSAGASGAETAGEEEDQSYSYSPFLDVANGDFVENIHSKAAYFIGTCSIGSPFQFVVGGFSGKGVIGTKPRPQQKTQTQSNSVHEHSSGLGSESESSLKTFITSINFVNPIDEEQGEIVPLMDQIEPNFFTFSSPSSSSSLGPNKSNSTNASPTSSFLGLPFIYDGVESEALSPVSVSCSSDDPIDMIVIVGDDEQEDIGATVTHTLGSDAVHVELTGGARSSENLRAESITHNTVTSISDKNHYHNPLGGQGRRHLRTIKGGGSPTDIWLKKAEKSRYLKAKTTKDNVGCSLIQMTIHDSLGKEVPKTLVVCSEYHDSFRSRKLQQGDLSIRLGSVAIDENADVEFQFAGLEDLELLEVYTIRLDARIGMKCQGTEAIGIVDMSAMLSWNDPTLVVNGGWFRRAANIHDVNCDWEPVVLNAIATDPDAKYTFLGRLDHPTSAIIMNGNASGRNLSKSELNSRRNILKASPTKDELDINEDMTRGRKPSSSNSARNLEDEKHKKILVHGYCGKQSDFPTEHFTDAIQFSDPDSTSPKASSWSNDQFARKIYKFTKDNDIHGCGIIGHSHGGIAGLHLKEHYWSCLDNATSGSRLIQSVGTPYQGTILAGTMAAIGGIFGIGCGRNYDLTEDGATRWLRSISHMSRGEVYFYLTGAPTGWFSTPCLFSADLLLRDPEDGVVERSRGDLPGGNNAGYTSGQCHTFVMWYGNQCLDLARNSEINSNAKY